MKCAAALLAAVLVLAPGVVAAPAASETAAPVAIVQEVHTATGVLQTVDARSHTLSVRIDSQTRDTYHYTEKTLMSGPDGELTPEALERLRSSRVRVSWIQEARRKVAISITVLQPR